MCTDYLGICRLNIKQTPELLSWCRCLEPALCYLLRAVTFNSLLGSGLSVSAAPVWCMWEGLPAEILIRHPAISWCVVSSLLPIHAFKTLHTDHEISELNTKWNGHVSWWPASFRHILYHSDRFRTAFHRRNIRADLASTLCLRSYMCSKQPVHSPSNYFRGWRICSCPDRGELAFPSSFTIGQVEWA